MKLKAKLILIIAVLATVAVFVAAIVYAPPKTDSDEAAAQAAFITAVDGLGYMENDRQSAVPQTEIYNLIKSHFESPLAQGKAEKKAIVIGYDGCRTDALTAVDDLHDSAVKTLLDDGGHAVFCYCGGANYPAENTQKTSTAPGWCSMLTGVWANTIGITGNGQPKPLEPKTLLLGLVEDGKVDSSAFYVSWKGHFTRKNATYINEKNYIEQNGVNSVFLRASNDKGTVKNVLNDINKADCSDFIFLTLEYTDHSGHASGFSLNNPEYVDGFHNAEKSGKQFIDAIKARPTYDNEDWLIIITTDHGGIIKDHGGSSYEERLTFIISNKEITE